MKIKIILKESIRSGRAILKEKCSPNSRCKREAVYTRLSLELNPAGKSTTSGPSGKK
jgi:hypothetical protein